jgi:hypothetical protein
MFRTVAAYQYDVRAGSAPWITSTTAARPAGTAPLTRPYSSMDMFPDQSPSPPAKPKMSAEERRMRQEDRLKTIRLRMAIDRYLDDREITNPAAIGEALGMPAAEAVKLMTRHQWREGDVALLEAAAARLGLSV